MMLRKALIAAGLRRSRSAFVERSTSGDGSYRVAGYQGDRAMIIILRFWRILAPISDGCKGSRISRCAVKSRCACEWGGWGRLSDDGPGHYNPDPSERPWGG